MKLNTYFVLLAPAKTPPAIIALLEREVQKAVKLRDLQKMWEASEIAPLGTSAPRQKLLKAELPYGPTSSSAPNCHQK